jgi:predicted short-subunit dehydrogenase-like oxidoreductase (DUF2520 family)
METQKIVILGCGNVASYFADRFMQMNHIIIQVYHPELQKATSFVKPYQAQAIAQFSEINKEADLYFIAVKDSAIEALAVEMPNVKGIVVHTSGAIKLAALNMHARAAVFYPLQTFTKGIKTANQDFPLLIESKEKADENYLEQLAVKMGMKVHFINSNQRTEIHLAAVFAANFSNHCIKIGFDLMASNNHTPEMLLPLIKESIHKLNYISPAKAQTGPAVRHDDITIEKHLNMLNNDASLKLLYELLTKNIQSSNQ